MRSEIPEVLSPAVQERAIAVAEIVLCSSVPTQLLIGYLLRSAGWVPLRPDGQLSFAFVLVLSIADTVLLVALMMMLTRAHGERAADLWIGHRPIGRDVIHGILLIPVIFLIVVILLNLLRAAAPWLHNVETNPLEQLAATPSEAALFAVVAIVAGGVREELQRAFLLRRFERHLGGPVVGVVALGVGFGLGHVVQGWDAMITTGLLGILWAVIYLRRRSVVAPLISHAGFNALEVIRVAAVGL